MWRKLFDCCIVDHARTKRGEFVFRVWATSFHTETD